MRVGNFFFSSLNKVFTNKNEQNKPTKIKVVRGAGYIYLCAFYLVVQS